jgi:thioredoxin 1
MAPIADAIAQELKGLVKVVKINVYEAQDAAARYGVMGVPNFLVFKDGQVKGQLVGARAKQALLDAVKPHMA